MIALVIVAALIIQTHDSQTKIVPNLTEEGCEAARCMAKFGKSCIGAAVDGVEDHRRHERYVAYEKAHPLICTKSGSWGEGCYRLSEPAWMTTMPISSSGSMSSNATSEAICVR